MSNAGDVTAWSATISGLSITATDLGAAGWTRLTGTTSTGQTTTKALILDNGLVRVFMDRNVTGSAGSLKVLFFDGSTWGTQLQSGGVTGILADQFTATRVVRNDRHAAIIDLQYRDAGQSLNPTARILLLAGEPCLRFYLAEEAGIDLTHTTSQNATVLQHTAAGAVTAYDSLGNAASFAGATAMDWVVMRRLSEDIEVVLGKTEAGAHNLVAQSALQGFGLTNPTTPPLWYTLGFIERAYGAGDGGGVDVGNGDGHLREGEDNFTAVAGTWAKATSFVGGGASGSAAVRNSTPALNDEVSWSINFPAVGDYYIGVRVVGEGSGGFLEVGVAGTDSGTPVAIPVDIFSAVEGQNVYGPFTIASAGDKTVDARISTLGSLTQVDIDHLCLYAFEASTGTVPFAKNLADSMLLPVKPLP